MRDLQETVDLLEEDKSKLEQTSHRLRQELEISNMAVKELQSSQDSAGELENEVDRLKDELRLKDERLVVLKKVCVRVHVCSFVCVCVFLVYCKVWLYNTVFNVG